MPNLKSKEVTIGVSNEDIIYGILSLPDNPRGIIVFAHGSGSNKHSPRDSFVSEVLNDNRFGTLLLDLLTSKEALIDEETKKFRFDIELLTNRLVIATNWLDAEIRESKSTYPIGYFGASTGAASAIAASVILPRGTVKAIVSRGGRPDLVGSSTLGKVTSPILLLVGGSDVPTISLNQQALQQLKSARERKLVIIPGAGHLFEEPGALKQMTRITVNWFKQNLDGEILDYRG
jgi:putative phosphoribosyl transferase